ncbi:MAG: hypothetical protein ACK4S4_03585 [Pyrinomonadaceae bacterium]
MESEKSNKKIVNDRGGERGAALVMALLVSFLLLVASAGLLLESAANSQNVTDAVAEQQAYSAAESGIQSAVNALRVAAVPSPLCRTDLPATDPANKLTFINAIKPSCSNAPGDASTEARLSRWLTYSSTCSERVVLGTATCDRRNGFGYSLAFSDPDNVGSIVDYTTSIIFYMPGGNVSQANFGSGGNTTRITYTPAAVTGFNTAGGSATTNFGTFNVQLGPSGGALITSYTRFEIVVSMTRPYTATRTLRGWIESNTSATQNQPPKILFDAQTYTLQGSIITLNFGWGSPTFVTDRNPPQHYGYEATLNNGPSVLTGTMTSPEPTRLLVRSTGFGPRGATKTLEAIVQKDFFNGLTAPATLTLVGPASTPACPSCTPPTPATTFTFNPGSSSVTVYSGDDTVTTDVIPPIGTTNPGNLETVETSVDGLPPHPFNGTVVGSPSDVSTETPWWLSSPSMLDSAVRSLYTVANSSGRFFPQGTNPPNFGNFTTAQGITFCDGDCTFTGQGGGVLVVTGQLTLHGNFSFKGMIIVTGQGGVNRTGGGTGDILGNMVLAPYVGSRIFDGISPTSSSSFLAPQYDLSGGGTSTIRFDSSAVAGGLVAVSNFVLGVVEK